MTHKLLIETESRLRNVHSATFSQQLLEQLAAAFIAEQQGIDLNAEGVRIHAETNINPEAHAKRRVNVRVSVTVDEPIEDADEGDGYAIGAETASNATDSHLSL